MRAELLDGDPETDGQVSFADLLPTRVVVEQTDQDLGDEALLPAERAYLARAVASRRSEFATVRQCARRGLARLGYDPVAIVPGPNREPQWPAGIVGSLTHCRGLRAAAVAISGPIRSIGIDAELNEPLPPGVLDLVSDARERQHLAELEQQVNDVAWDRLLFSAKESIYKAWYPMVRSWLDFTECVVRFDPEARSFSCDLLPQPDRPNIPPLTSLRGKWRRDKTHVITAVWHPLA